MTTKKKQECNKWEWIAAKAENLFFFFKLAVALRIFHVFLFIYNMLEHSSQLCEIFISLIFFCDFLSRFIGNFVVIPGYVLNIDTYSVAAGVSVITSWNLLTFCSFLHELFPFSGRFFYSAELWLFQKSRIYSFWKKTISFYFVFTMQNRIIPLNMTIKFFSIVFIF